MAGKRKKPTMSDAHKEALAEGREAGRAVRLYLEALEAQAPRRRGRRPAAAVDPQAALAQVEAKMVGAGVLERLLLAQRRVDLLALVDAGPEAGPDMADLEARFLKVAGRYTAAKGLTRAAWLEVKVPKRVLNEAGIR